MTKSGVTGKTSDFKTFTGLFFAERKKRLNKANPQINITLEKKLVAAGRDRK